MPALFEELADYCLAALLRCHRSPQGEGMQSNTARISVEEREEILLRWALSGDLKRLAERVVEQPRNIRSAIAFEPKIYSGSIPGAVDARATLYEQELSGDATLFVVTEPSVSPLTRRNHVLAWALHEAEMLIFAGIRRHQLGPEQEWIHSRAALLENATKSPPIREVIMSPMGRRRPGEAAIRDCIKSMSPLYRAAAQALLNFERVEAMEPSALRTLLQDTLIARLETWQLVELAAGIAAAEALATACEQRVQWRGSITGASEIIAIGPYRVLWQNTLNRRHDDHLDTSEKMARDAARALGAVDGLARTDLSITRDGEVVAHLEAKSYVSEGSAPYAIANAVAQLVRYCRDSRPSDINSAANLLKNSIVVCSALGRFHEQIDGSAPVGLIDFAGLRSGRLDAWARRIHSTLAIESTV